MTSTCIRHEEVQDLLREAGDVTAQQGTSFADAGGNCSGRWAQEQSLEVFDLDFVGVSWEGSHEQRGNAPCPVDAQLAGSAHEHALRPTAVLE